MNISGTAAAPATVISTKYTHASIFKDTAVRVLSHHALISGQQENGKIRAWQDQYRENHSLFD